MPHGNASHGAAGHAHGSGARLEPAAEAILERGLAELLRMTEGLAYKPLPSETYPLPLARAVYADAPPPGQVRDDVLARLHSDPVSALEESLALLELYESNQPDIAEHVLEDMPFIRACFNSKRCNGWIAAVGDADRAAIEKAVNARWQFKFFNGRPGPTGIYALLNMLARYAFVYGRIEAGDAHELSHFVEEHCPGLIICRGRLSDLELTLSLAAMKMGVPAVVPGDYPFPLGRMLRADKIEEVVEATVGFSNIRRRLNFPDIPQLPSWCDPENRKQVIVPAITWGGTPNSFYAVQKGSVAESGVEVVGEPGPDIGVLLTIDAEPLDAFDRRYIESSVIGTLSLIRGVAVKYDDSQFLIEQSPDARLRPEQVGETLVAAVRRDFPRLTRVRAEIIGDPKRLARLAPEVRAEKEARRREIESATEESVGRFCTCVGCSPFAPDHVCVLTPERAPQCGRPYEMIKTGALYAYDDMTNIHHSKLHRDINSFGTVDKGRPVDPLRGEWQGVNERVAELTHGRTKRVQLHSLDAAPHTGCGCFRMIMFKTDAPRDGIGIMDSAYAGKAPDGRSWRDLHYALAGKQTPGVAGASRLYLFSKKFLQGHGGWKSVVWVAPAVAEIMGDKLPPGILVGVPVS